MSKIRVFAFLSALALLLGAYGCGGGGDAGAAKVVIVTTDALYEIASAVGAGRIEVTSLLSGGAEIHNFEPAVSDQKRLPTPRL
ncbi:MAG: zinc ABC transporter substrate-binding protein [Clostridiales bacterium]|nr:zinc ABC transporter substrate-binding protein [Clostridiales bacterium]